MDSFNVAAKFMKTNDFSESLNTMTDSGSLEMKDDLEFVVSAYMESFKYLPLDEVKKTIAQVQSEFNIKKGSYYTDKLITKHVKGYVKTVIDCGLEEGTPMTEFNTNGKGRARAGCLMKSGVLNAIFATLRGSLDPQAAEGLYYTEQVLGAYATAKTFKDLPQATLDMVDIARVEAEMAGEFNVQGRKLLSFCQCQALGQ